MNELPLRDRLLILLRNVQWHSERQLCRAICRRYESTEVSKALDLLMSERLVEYHDVSFNRYRLTAAGRAEAARAWERVHPKKGKAA